MSDSCEVYARMALHKAKQKDPPIDVQKVAKALKISIEEKDGGNRYEGCLLRYNDVCGIMLNKSIKSETRKRFTLAHEIGHAEIPTHTRMLYQCSKRDIDFSFKQREQEKEANAFAASLLMPEDFITETINNNALSLDSIKKIAKQCQTSFISSAIKYIKYCPEPALIILSEENKVKFYCLTEELHAKKIFYLAPDNPLIKGSVAHNFYNKQRIITAQQEEKRKISLNVWFHGQDYSKYDCFEHAISFPNLNRTLSLIWLEEKYDDEDIL